MCIAYDNSLYNALSENRNQQKLLRSDVIRMLEKNEGGGDEGRARVWGKGKECPKGKKCKSLLIKFSYDTAQSMKERMLTSTAEIIKAVVGN